MFKKWISFVMLLLLSISMFGCGSAEENNFAKYEKWSQKYIDESEDLSNKMEAYWDTLDDENLRSAFGDEPEWISKDYSKEELEKWDGLGCKRFTISKYTLDTSNELLKLELIKDSFLREFGGKQVATIYDREVEPDFIFSIYDKSSKRAYLLEDGSKCGIYIWGHIDHSDLNNKLNYVSLIIQFYK